MERNGEVGERMRAAAQAAGLGVGAVAKALGVTPKTVHRWWNGEREPSASDMWSYCNLVGVDVAEMYGERVGQRSLQALMEFADRLMAGRPMGRALEQTFGAGVLTEAEREAADASSAAVRAHLARAAEREWDLLTDQEKQQILSEVHRLAQERGRRGGSVRGRTPPGAIA